uniref:Uncharacterized protein n=1 Tax=Anguilla anguilla TaxID=7936 RepID=A0A0E9SJS1_ANGAN
MASFCQIFLFDFFWCPAVSRSSIWLGCN